MWENPNAIKGRSHPMGPVDKFPWEKFINVCGDLFASLSSCSVSFIRVPRIAAGRKEVEEWRVDPPASGRGTSFPPRALTAYPPENVLALVGWTHP